MIFFFNQTTAYEMRISDGSSDVCSSDFPQIPLEPRRTRLRDPHPRRERGEAQEKPRLPLANLRKFVRRRVPNPEPRIMPAHLHRPELRMHERPPRPDNRSEEHTSELQSLMRISYAGFSLKKKTTK